jgi:hypothetical protein
MTLAIETTAMSVVREVQDVERTGPSSTRPMFSCAATWTRAPCRVHQLSRARISRASFATTHPSHAKQPPKRKQPDKLNYNPVPSFGASAKDESETTAYPQMTANDLESHVEPPTKVKMLVRDFIEDSLYNPHYGYFTKQATIFSAMEQPIDFGRMRDGAEFQEEVAARYAAYGLDEKDGPGRQIWHTPTELLQVHLIS